MSFPKTDVGASVKDEYALWTAAEAQLSAVKETAKKYGFVGPLEPQPPSKQMILQLEAKLDEVIDSAKPALNPRVSSDTTIRETSSTGRDKEAQSKNNYGHNSALEEPLTKL
jgi:hypothetical protein